jgi:hypothetical protein
LGPFATAVLGSRAWHGAVTLSRGGHSETYKVEEVGDGRPLRKANGMPFTLPFSPDTIRWRRSAIVELRKLGIDL